MKCSDIITQEELENLNLVQLIERINTIPKTTIKELRFSDLYQPRNSCHGIYFIKSPQNIIYIGTATKRCIADRIGGHFDSRKGSFLNSFLKKVAEEETDEAMHCAFMNVLDWEFSVLFTEGNETQSLTKLTHFAEQLLIYYYTKHKQCLNGCRRKRPYSNLNFSLKDLMK